MGNDQMTDLTKQSGIGLVFILAFALAACSGSGSAGNDPSQPTPPTTGDTGFFNLSISDAPIKDAAKVCIRFDGVELKHADSDERETIDFEQPQVVNLLAHQGANSHPIVTGAEIPAGEYEWIRLKVLAERGLSGGVNDANPDSEICDEETESSYLVRKSGGLFNLFIPSGSQRGLQLIKNIVIPANRTGEYTAEWDLGKSFNGPPGLLPDVMMKPVVKLVANNEVGTLVGQVADELVALESCDAGFPPSVYVFDDGIVPNPFDDPFAEDDAVATALVERQTQDDGSRPWRYSIGFLLAGDYEVAFTCNGNDFIPLAGKPATIVVDEVTTVNFDFEDAPGTLVGQVDGVLVAPESCSADFDPAVYVFKEGVVPNFVEDPVATGEVVLDSTTEQYGYSIPLQAANYNAAFTCTGTDFIPVAGKSAEILPATATTLDFLAGDAPAQVGSLSGRVAAALVEADTCSADFEPAVYVFNKDVTPNDTDVPVATGPVILQSSSEAWEYLIADLLVDTYTAAFTCTGNVFVPEEGSPAVISSGEVTPLDF